LLYKNVAALTGGGNEGGGGIGMGLKTVNKVNTDTPIEHSNILIEPSTASVPKSSL